MKNLRSMFFALTVLLMASAAQAQTTNVLVKVPFDFVIGDRAYPAGEYNLKSMLPDGIPIRVDNLQQSSSRIVQSNTCNASVPSTATKLIFRHLGDHYFLYQVWQQGNSSGREFSIARQETRLAQNHEKPELVIVAANISR